MAKIKHVAITCEDPDASGVKFYKEWLRPVRSRSNNARQIQLSDGDQPDHLQVEDQRGLTSAPTVRTYDGIHHIGFQVEAWRKRVAKLCGRSTGGLIVRREVMPPTASPVPPRAEDEVVGPNGQVLDASEPGWLHIAPMD